MAQGHYLIQGDRTTCGGIITEGDPLYTLYDRPVAREGDAVTCGVHAGLYRIAGAIPDDELEGRGYAGTLHSRSTCPCQAGLIASITEDTYEV
ncbi:PAAR domain-containing protein [Nissabacter sp. SGAir0207]|uniref:PAAR domain-containing protein n=1 Tax=Nissabacter sp. SGAir0207 TaxID=2126321 RepID=UPI0010CD3FC2|nr:PAAR domain-containing protein [Nissabacter sp. SGAir0207]QCR38499.1 PAAR domain-containing protein [Nissabacter sp. SGAir0207]